jgi:predicted dehydrogenase
MDQVSVGIIGYGYWGPNLTRNIAEIPHSKLVAIADLNADRLKPVTGRYPHVVTTNDYRDFFELPLNAVVIATPPSTHFAIALDCLRHGLHIWSRSP